MHCHIDGCLSGFLTALGQAGRSFIASITGTLLFPIIGLVILVPSMGLNGVYLMPLFSSIMSAILSIVLIVTIKSDSRDFGRELQV